MQLIIKQYLSLLKESDELDRLLPDLLLSMGIEPTSRAQAGPRQYGVDATAVGRDENGKKTFFIFTIKQGDIGRSDWDGTPQCIRPSLDEIKDVYIPTHIEEKYKDLPKRIIVCTGGEKKQAIALNWSQYVNQNQESGQLEYDFWGGDKLSLLIEEHLFNEAIIPVELQSSLRKVLALVSDPDYDLSDYHSILNGILIETDYGDVKKPSGRKKVCKALRTVNLCQNIIHFWAKNEGNIKPAVYCSEKTVLYGWDFVRRHELYKSKKIAPIFYEIYKTLHRIYADYFVKVQGHCYVRNGFCGYGRHHVQENLNIFEHLGLLSTTGLLCLYQALIESNEELLGNANIVLDALKAYIDNHHATALPCYDEHIIEISAAILFLSTLDEKEFVNEWIGRIVDQVVFSYRSMGQYFPIHSDSFDDLVALNVSRTVKKEELFGMSTLLPILAQWCIALDLDQSYTLIREVVEKFFPECTLQIWYPDEETDALLYVGSANRTGAVDAPIELVEDIEEMEKRMTQAQKNTINIDDITSVTHGLIVLPILASRQYRTPLMPFYWQHSVVAAK